LAKTPNLISYEKLVSVDLEGKTVGRKQASGFINAYNIEPITYRPDENFSNPNTKVSYYNTFDLMIN
jgi:hypothetical protein